MSNKEKGTGERIVEGLADAAMAPLNAGSGMAMGLIGGLLIGGPAGAVIGAKIGMAAGPIVLRELAKSKVEHDEKHGKPEIEYWPEF